jgi:hypothetical protein
LSYVVFVGGKTADDLTDALMFLCVAKNTADLIFVQNFRHAQSPDRNAMC